MGRVKLPMKRIESTTNRQVTYSKRRNGLIKKAYELSVLCDIDIALIMFSPSGRLSQFSSKASKIEDVFARFLNLDDPERESDVPDRESLLRILTQLRNENDLALHRATSPAAANSDIEELQQQIAVLQQQLQGADKEIRKYEPDLLEKTSIEELEQCEKHLLDTLERVQQTKRNLLADHDQYNSPIAMLQQAHSDSFQIEGIDQWLPENIPNNPQFFPSSSDQPLRPVRDLSSTFHQSSVDGMPSNINRRDIVESRISNLSKENVSCLLQDYASTYSHSFNMISPFS